MTLVQWGSLLFGVAVGWISHRSLRRRADEAGLSSVASVAMVIGSAAITASLKMPDAFGLYGVGLLSGFFAYLLVDATLSRSRASAWLGEESSTVASSSTTDVNRDISRRGSFDIRNVLPDINIAKAFPDIFARGELLETLEATARRFGARRRAVPVPPPKPANRYANVELSGTDSGQRLDEARPLVPGQIIRLNVDIGARSPVSHVVNPVELPEDKLPRDIDLDVMVTSTDFEVALEASLLGPERTVAHGQLHLPNDGSAATTPAGDTQLSFYLKAPSDVPTSRKVHARIGYYYNNILVQSQRLNGNVGGHEGFAVVTDYTLSSDLRGLDRLPTRPRISILTNANGDGGHQIVVRHPGQRPASEDSGGTITIKDGVDHTIAQLREVLTERAPSEKARAKNRLVEDLRQLAPLGRSLYDQLPGQLPAWTFARMRANPDQFVVQVARPTTSAFVLPWAFVYDIPLNSNTKPVLCPLIEQWDGSRALFDEPSPRMCPCGPHAADVLCPFGFWGFRYAIEQLSRTDVTEMDISIGPSSNFVVGEVQYNVDLRKLGQHVDTLRSILGRALPRTRLSEGKDRATVQSLLGDDIPFVYFFCHGQNADDGEANTWLSVGNRERITAGDFIGWTQTWADSGKRVWNKVRPLIFINACHSLAISSKTLVSYLDAFVGNACASGVIGTEVKVAQGLAMDFAEQFFTKWLSGTETVESALRAARIDFLRQGNLFGLVYTPYCWSELKIAAAKAAA